MSLPSTGQASQNSRLQVNSQLQKPIPGPPNPADVFEEYDFEPSQTPTRPRGRNANSPDGSPLVLGDSGENLDLGHLDHCLEDTIFEKGVTGNRAKVPPNIRRDNGVGVEVNARTALTSPALKEPQGANIEAQSYVIWQHSDLENIDLNRLIILMDHLKDAGPEKIAVGLSKRLLNRVRLVTERDFVNGNFLTPAVMRYDLHNASLYCMFVSFPYFAVAGRRTQKKFDKGDGRHPIRTLLQSRYRLNETVDRDKSQCIRMIGGSALKSCIQAPVNETERLIRQLNNDLIYVPQMWTLIMGPGHVLTVGPISDRALRTSTAILKNDPVPKDARKCSSVRISFMNNDILERITYPRDQCASWFGLLNKHSKIYNALPQKEKQHTSYDFPLMIRGQVLTDKIWASLQRLASQPILDLWMKVPQMPELAVKASDEGPSHQDQQLSQNEDEMDRYASIAKSTTTAGSEELQYAPVVKAFLFLARHG
ncbi:MAG: hypothetical protein Q9223_003157 [Gallowayella weberi]